MGLGARMSLIIYLQLWSESMALAPSIWQISLVSPRNLDSLSSSEIRREIFGFGKTPLWEFVPFVDVTLVSKFQTIWCLVA
jgi:hypothetical protein